MKTLMKHTPPLGLIILFISTLSLQAMAGEKEELREYNSTFTELAGGIVLRDYTWDELNKNIMIHPEDIVDYSPVTEKYVG